VINVVSSSAVNPVIVRRVCTMILSSFANNGTSTRLATVAVSYSVVSVGALDGVSLGLLDDGLLDGSSLGSLDGVSLGLLDGSLDRSLLDRSMETKVAAAATMTRQRRLRRISILASFVRLTCSSVR